MTNGGPSANYNDPSEELRRCDPLPPWHPILRALFRFSFCYFVLYTLYALSVLYLYIDIDLFKGQPVLPITLALRDVVPWVGRHLLGIQRPIEFGIRAGTLFDFVQDFCLLVFAFLGAVAWSILDRKRTAYRVLHEWLNLLLRLTLAAIMFLYGFDKIFPLQFHSITRLDLMQPLGDMNHFSLMWKFMAASTPYTVFCGSLEVFGGILLLVPRVATLGALVCAVVLSNVFALNMAYNVNIKLFSFNLLLMAVFLASPDFSRLFNLLVMNRPVHPQRPVLLAKPTWIDKGARILLIALGACLFVVCMYSNWTRYAETKKALAVTVPLQGMWLVDEFIVSGEPQHSLFTRKLASDMHIAQGEDRWAMLIIETPGQAVIQTRNGIMDSVNFDLDKTATAAALSDGGDDQWKGQLRFQQLQQDRLSLTGEVNGVTIAAKLHRMDESRFVLQNEPFNLFED
jgi:uncharacterized membrane protein YphA (DoxX/SURF4 family)